MLTVLDEEDEDPRVPLSLVVLEGGTQEGDKPVVLSEKVDVLRRSEMGAGANGNGNAHAEPDKTGAKRKRSASPAPEKEVEGKKGKVEGNGTGKGKGKAAAVDANGVVAVDDIHEGAIMIDDD